MSLLLVSSTLYGQSYERSSSFLGNGNILKMSIPQSGVYKVTPQMISDAGFGQVPSTQIQVMGAGGMLPQINSEEVPFDPPETAIFMDDGGDGMFNGSDYLLFYAAGPHEFAFDPSAGFFNLQKNYYSDTAYYFLKIDGENGMRMETKGVNGEASSEKNTFLKGYFIEEDLNSRPFLSGREWFGDKFSATNLNNTYSFETGSIVPNSDIIINSQILGYSFGEASMDVSVNGLNPGTHFIRSVEDYRYAVQGHMVSDTFAISSSLVNGNTLNVSLSFNPNSSARISEAFMDKIIVMVEKPLTVEGGQLVFTVENSQVTHYNFSGNIKNLTVWDIGNTTVPKEIPAVSPGKYKLAVGPTRLVAFDESTTLTPPIITKVENQNIKDITVPDLLIVTHSNFEAEAERLAAFRRTNNGFDVEVVNVNEIYNEFSSGRSDISAIRNFARYLFYRSESPGKFKYMLLFGKGTFDHKNQRGANLNFVPIYESRNSLHPLATYGSDDYYGFLEPGEGYWEESRDGDHTLDIAIGRLPVKTPVEAKGVVDKLINYEGDHTMGNWRNKIVFVADDGDFNIHNSQSDQLAEFVDTTFNRFNYQKLFLDNFEQIPAAGGERSPAMEEELNRTIDEGALIVNYTGHGGESGWMQEFVLDQFMVNDWNNRDKLPLFVTATCEFGRHDSPLRISTGELTILNPNGGGIGLVTTSRPVLSSSNFVLNKAFYNAVFKTENGRNKTLGEVFAETKNNSLNGVSNRNFSLLGDPSMTLAYPENNIVITSVKKDGDPSDSLSATSFVEIQGEIRDFNEFLISDFMGELDLTLYDKAQRKKTLGNENPPFEYKTWSNLIFKGRSTVKGGKFSVELIIPKNIDYTIGDGKISMYAIDDNGRDASGTELNIKIGGSSQNSSKDSSAPEIELFIGDLTFKNGGYTLPDTRLIGRLYDESGINISNFGIGQGIELVLDGEKRWELNNYYLADTDDFTQGTVEFPLFDLEPGAHTLELTAWDTFNNRATSMLNFIVTDGDDMVLTELRAYPNPFSDFTTIGFRHNRTGENLEVVYNIISSQGKIVSDGVKQIDNAPARLELLEWNGAGESREKTEQGLYFIGISVRSLKDGAKNRIFGKLIYHY